MPVSLRHGLRCALLLAPLAACSAPSLTLIDWNTYHLFDHRRHETEACAWLAARRPRLVALQEVLHVDEAGLRELAAGWGHPFAVMHKERGYPVALTSSASIEVIERRVEGFHHGYLHARTHGLDVVVVHFWPGKVHEAEHVASLARALVAAGRRVLVLGDCNAEIRHDLDHLQTEGDFGTVRGGTRSFDFRITDALLDAGLVDVVHEHAPTAHYTFGSPALIPEWRRDLDDVRRVRRRIDFVFADAHTAMAVREAEVVTDDRTVGAWSDHYPIVVDLRR